MPFPYLPAAHAAISSEVGATCFLDKEPYLWGRGNGAVLPFT
jgi:hypothetical protein